MGTTILGSEAQAAVATASSGIEVSSLYLSLFVMWKVGNPFFLNLFEGDLSLLFTTGQGKNSVMGRRALEMPEEQAFA